MHTAEYINFFRNQTDNRVTELQEEIAGIEKRLSTLYLDKENLSNESKENANKFLLTTNPTLLNIIQEKQNQLDDKIKSIDKEIVKYKKSQSKKQQTSKGLKIIMVKRSFKTSASKNKENYIINIWRE